MNGIADIFRWLVDTAAASAVLLALASGVMFLIRQPARRLRVGELALIGCLLVAMVQAIPATRFSLGLVEIGQPVRLPWFDDQGQITPLKASGSDAHTIVTARTPAAAIVHAAPIGITYWREIILTLWALGVLAMTIRLAVAWRSLRQIAHRGRRAHPHLLELWQSLLRQNRTPAGNRVVRTVLLVSADVNRPMTFGIRQPVVLLPAAVANASQEDVTAILRHELGHVERGDAWTWLLAAIANVLLFFLPPLWLIKREMRLAQEYLADRAAADNAGGSVAYAEIMVRLVSLTQLRQQPMIAELAMGAWTGRSDLMLRVRHLFNVRMALERRCARRWTLVATLCVLLLTAGLGAMTLADTSLKSKLRTAELRGVTFLLSQQQATGGWLTEVGPAPTALVVRSLLQAGVPVSHPAILRARQYVASCRRSDGGYYTDGEPTYQTAIVMSMYAAVDDSDAHQRIEDGREFLRHELERPIKAPGAWYQNSELSATGKLSSPFADPGERTADAILETYGSLTYTRWKSLVYAGLQQTDPRVKQAATWLTNHWTLDKHPGTGSAEGLYYYYLAAARTLKAAGTDNISGHDWRNELDHRLLNAQAANGSWINAGSGRWLEDRREMVTAYALLALQETR